jgi:hypothetical protein
MASILYSKKALGTVDTDNLPYEKYGFVVHKNGQFLYADRAP